MLSVRKVPTYQRKLLPPLSGEGVKLRSHKHTLMQCWAVATVETEFGFVFIEQSFQNVQYQNFSEVRCFSDLCKAVMDFPYIS
jgi:hypothetical protein